MRKVIGVVPLYDDEKESYWMLPGYMKALEIAGALPIMLPLSTDRSELDDAFSLCDGILFTGGHDVDPKEYGAERNDYCGLSCSERDEMEGYLLDLSIKEDKPFLGICRGIQFMNAHLGGTLYQDLPSEHKSLTEHHMTSPYDKVQHNVSVFENTLLSEIIGAGTHGVNSYHHQAINLLSDKLEEMAISEDGLIEAVRVKNVKFGIGIQWHPEFSYMVNDDSTKLIQAFVNACI